MNVSIKPAEAQKLASSFLASRHRLLIDGKWIDARSGKTFEVRNPADGKIIADVAWGEKEDIDLAVKAARRAFDHGPWTKMSPSDRGRMIWKLGDAVEAVSEEMALLETLDNGKPLKMSRMMDVAGSADKLRYCAGWATKLAGSTLDVSVPGQHQAFTLREPVGVAGLIVPWNFPLMMAVQKIGAALAAGCTVVLKPAEQTPLTALRLGELMQEIGFPEGVVNIVTGFGEAGAALVEHPGVDKISFTGSTEVGKKILRAATGNLKRVTLELGGKSPVMVFPDADMDAAIAGVSRGISFNSGQVCNASTRLFAHKKVFDRLIEGIAGNVGALKLGPGVNGDTDMGPLVSQEQLDRVTGYVNAGVKAGAKVLIGGERFGNEGYFVKPTVLTDTTADMSVRREEIFGPVLCAMSFSDDDLDRIAAEANDTEYGLAAHVFTKDISTAFKLTRKLKAGTVRINGNLLDMNVPFGGYKQSGWGRENGREGVESYTEIKSVLVAL